MTSPARFAGDWYVIHCSVSPEQALDLTGKARDDAHKRIESHETREAAEKAAALLNEHDARRGAPGYHFACYVKPGARFANCGLCNGTHELMGECRR